MQDAPHCEGPPKGGAAETSFGAVSNSTSLVERSWVKPEYVQSWVTVRVFAPGHKEKQQLSEYSLAHLVLFPFHALLVKGSLLRISPVVSSWTAVVLTLGAAVAFFPLLFLSKERVLRFPVEDVQNITTYMNSFCPFILGLYLSVSLGRWWALRTLGLQTVVDSLSNVYNFVVCHFPEPRHQLLRARVAHYSMLTVELMIRSAQSADNLADLVDFESLHALERKDLDLVPLKARAHAVVRWIFSLLHRAAKYDEVPPPQFVVVINELQRVSSGVSVVDMHRNTQLPFPYVQVISMLVQTSCVLLAAKGGITFAVAYHKQMYQTIAVEFVSSIAVPVMYYSLLAVAVVIEEPLGPDFLDFPMVDHMRDLKAKLGDMNPELHQVDARMEEVLVDMRNESKKFRTATMTFAMT
mmetsp:Transcript_10870/g.23179  ORF Transcript_10870/g.23179 Transcript_10870/m.23179 type:complete len:410 (-) Transcript_10870:2-1231(-)